MTVRDSMRRSKVQEIIITFAFAIIGLVVFAIVMGALFGNDTPQDSAAGGITMVKISQGEIFD